MSQYKFNMDPNHPAYATLIDNSNEAHWIRYLYYYIDTYSEQIGFCDLHGYHPCRICIENIYYVG